MSQSAHVAGANAARLAQQLGERLGITVVAGLPAEFETGAMVFLNVRPEPGVAEFVGGNAFAACRALKRDNRVRVFLVVDHDDPYTPEIARFCLADGCVLSREGEITDVSVVEGVLRAASNRTAVDELLEQLEREIASDEGKKRSAIQRIFDEERHDWVIEHLTDPATGLFSATFASVKLEEEFKRANRFHQPLSLILLDIGAETLPAKPAFRDAVLAEVASVFLVASRDIDVLARFTESTFLFLLPGTGSAGAAVVARRMLDELASRSYTGGARLTPHAGLATVPAAGIQDRGAFLARAEACLRLAHEGQGAEGLCVSCE